MVVIVFVFLGDFGLIFGRVIIRVLVGVYLGSGEWVVVGFFGMLYRYINVTMGGFELYSLVRFYFLSI